MGVRGRAWLAVSCAAALLPACPGDVFVDTTTLADTTTTDIETSLATVTGAPPSDADPTALTTSTSNTETTGETSPPGCRTVDDCLVSACRRAVACDVGECIVEDRPAGAVLDAQVAGDCQRATCDEHGSVMQLPDPADLPDDEIACTLDACDGATPLHTPQSEPCYTGPKYTRDIGLCVGGTRTCDLDLRDWGACLGEVTPGSEDCDADHADEDCDGMVDESGFACVCGDEIVSVGELCDDGNQSNADACTTDCEAQQVLEVAHGGRHACARLTDGRVKCWGDGDSGACGLGDTADRGDAPNEMGQSLPDVLLDAVRTPRSLAAGYSHTCAVFTDGALKCWGRNDTGQLGLGDKQHRGDFPGEMGANLPVLDLGVGQLVVAASADLGYTCALLASRSIKCWGDNPFGQLGLGDTVDRGDDPGELGNALPPVSLGGGATAITTGTLHACALLETGAVKCWGANFNGTLGQGDTEHRGDEPGEMGQNLLAVDLGQPATAVAAGSAHSCALLEDGRIKCWGSNLHGQLGYGDTMARGDNTGEMGSKLLTLDLGPGETAIAITAGGDFSCALLTSGGLKCWGRNHNGQLGLGTATNMGDNPGEMGDSLPVVNLGTGLAAMAIDSPASGAFVACAVLLDGSSKCWGTGTYGSLGLGDTFHHGDQLSEMGNNLPRLRLFSGSW